MRQLFWIRYATSLVLFLGVWNIGDFFWRLIFKEEYHFNVMFDIVEPLIIGIVILALGFAIPRMRSGKRKKKR